jgi:uncharacterized protein (DUF885 family)
LNLIRTLTALFLFVLASAALRADSITELSDSFWQWRAIEQPFTNDDIPRIDRPAGFTVDWSASTIAARLKSLAAFEQRYKLLAPAKDMPIPTQVDYRLLGSAIARACFELSITQTWKRDPYFYVDQTIGSIFVLLLQPPPFDDARQQQIIARMKQIPATIKDAQTNLTDIRQPFAQLAIDALEHVDAQLQTMQKALAPQLSPSSNSALQQATPSAIAALTEYRTWLQKKLLTARKDTAIGRDYYIWFLRNVALLPYTPEQLLAMSRQEWSRSVAFESYQLARISGSAPVFPNAAAQIEAERTYEEKVRAFLADEKILSVPPWLQHYRNLAIPDYLMPLADMGVMDDLTGPDRLIVDGTSYIFPPSADLGFFYLSTAQDPRSILVHEGVPGHYYQLCLGWHNADPIRRHYYDSGANEGIGFYAEEMMLQAGFFDDNPHTRATIYKFMRLRALRVEVDVKLALGEFNLQQAADYLASTVPMDKKTALGEAAMFSSTPGQAITYQIGKIQIMDLLSDARRAKGADFSLLNFNDFVWNNGNVPLSLQRWEMLGDKSQVPLPSAVPQAQAKVH